MANQSTLMDVLKAIQKVCGKEAVSIGVEARDIKRLKVPARGVTRSWYGGLPFNRLIEFAGAEHSGKTTTALMSIGAYQKLPDAKKVLFVDVEGSYDPIWSEKMGVNNDEIILFTPTVQTAEEVLQFILDIAETGEIGFIVLDSIPALVPQNESEKKMGELTMGGISQPLTVFTRKMTRILNRKEDLIFIGINQLRDTLSAYGSPTRTVGGKMWKAGASLRIEFRSYNIDKDFKKLSNSAEGVEGAIIQATVVKNKTAPRDIKLGQYYVLFHSGFNEKNDIYEYALTEGIITQAGSSFRYVTSDGEEYKKQGKKNFLLQIEPHIWEDLVATVDLNVEIQAKGLEEEEEE